MSSNYLKAFNAQPEDIKGLILVSLVDNSSVSHVIEDDFDDDMYMTHTHYIVYRNHAVIRIPIMMTGDYGIEMFLDNCTMSLSQVNAWTHRPHKDMILADINNIIAGNFANSVELPYQFAADMKFVYAGMVEVMIPSCHAEQIKKIFVEILRIISV